LSVAAGQPAITVAEALAEQAAADAIARAAKLAAENRAKSEAQKKVTPFKVAPPREKTPLELFSESETPKLLRATNDGQNPNRSAYISLYRSFMQQFTNGVNLDLPRLISLLDQLAQAIPESGEARTTILVVILSSKLAFDGLSNAQIEQQLRRNFSLSPAYPLNEFLQNTLGPDLAVLQPPTTPSTDGLEPPVNGLEPDVLTPPVQTPATGAAGAALPLLIAAAALVLLN
jgi:hypothetical protein